MARKGEILKDQNYNDVYINKFIHGKRESPG